MPSKIKKRGKDSYLLTVVKGYDTKGSQITHTKTVKCSNAKEAEKQYALFVAEIEKGQVASNGKMTLAEFYDFWKENYALKNHQATTIVYNDALFARIREALGHMRLDKLTPLHMLKFYKNLSEPGIKKIQRKKNSAPASTVECLSANSVRKHHVLLNTLLNQAVKWNMIPYNPATRTDSPKVERKHKVIYTQEQSKQFLQCLEKENDKYKLMVLLALTGGLRREEIFGLSWNDIEFERNTVAIKQASIYTSKTGTITKSTKNYSSNRMVSLPVSVINLLQEYKISQDETKFELGDKWQESGRVFVQWDGNPAHPHSFNTWLKRFIVRNQLPHISPHDFRHMAATYLITAGTDIRTVSGKLGHAQTTTTMNTYSHLLKSAEQETASVMENILQNISKSTSEDEIKKE